jgi:hypothetical protein
MKFAPFREATRTEADLAASGNPYIVTVRYDSSDVCDFVGLREDILICRELDPQEIGRLKQAKTPDEVYDLLYLVKNINDPTEYEVDLRTV